MKGLAFRKLSRTSSHRNHLLRNLVTSLFQHDRISTTVAKAKEAQREAEKIITKVKRSQETDRRGANQQWRNACAYVFVSLTPPQWSVFRQAVSPYSSFFPSPNSRPKSPDLS